MVDEPVVGVIGGMGPAATVEFMRRVIASTPATDDRDHIHMIVDNDPKVPSRIEALITGTGESPAPTIAAMARRLERAGADFIVIPCNTAHGYWSAAAEAVDIPVWHLAELTLARVASEQGAPVRVGMLASPAVRRIQLYEPYAAAHGMSLLYATPEEDLLRIIRAVKAAGTGEREIGLLQQLAGRLADAGADVLVLGCTEFSLIADRLQASVPVYDTLQILAEAVVTAVKSGQVNPSPAPGDAAPP